MNEKCALCKQTIKEGSLVKIGDATICYDHLRNVPDLWNKIEPTEAVFRQLIALILENTKLKSDKEAYSEANLRNNFNNEITNLQTQIVKLNDNLTLSKFQNDYLMQMRDIKTLAPDMKIIGDCLVAISESMAEGHDLIEESNASLKKEIDALRNEMSFMKSDIMAKNNEGIDAVLAGVTNLKNECNGNYHATMTEFTTLKEITDGTQNLSAAIRSEMSHGLDTMKNAITGSDNSSSIKEINTKLEEIKSDNDDIWETLESKLDELLAPKVPEQPIVKVEEPKAKESIKEPIKEPPEQETVIIEPSSSIPDSITNPIQLEAYKTIQKSPCKGQNITDSIGGDDKQKQKVRDALKILRKHGHVVLEDGIYHIPT